MLNIIFWNHFFKIDIMQTIKTYKSQENYVAGLLIKKQRFSSEGFRISEDVSGTFLRVSGFDAHFYGTRR